jgi:hypothetical protein
MADGAIHTPLDVNPMGKDDKAWKFVHPLPRNLPACLHILDNLKCLRSFTDHIARMTSLTELDIGNPCNPIHLYKAVTEGTVQMYHLFVMDMVEKDGLIDGSPGKNWKDGEEDVFGLNKKSIVGNNGKKKNDDNNNKKGKSLFHIYYLPKLSDFIIHQNVKWYHSCHSERQRRI